MTANRCGRQMLAGITAEQTERLETLLLTPDGRRQGPLDRLHDGLVLQSATELARTVARLDEVRLLAARLPRTDQLSRGAGAVHRSGPDVSGRPPAE